MGVSLFWHEIAHCCRRDWVSLRRVLRTISLRNSPPPSGCVFGCTASIKFSFNVRAHSHRQMAAAVNERRPGSFRRSCQPQSASPRSASAPPAQRQVWRHGSTLGVLADHRRLSRCSRWRRALDGRYHWRILRQAGGHFDAAIIGKTKVNGAACDPTVSDRVHEVKDTCSSAFRAHARMHRGVLLLDRKKEYPRPREDPGGVA